MRFVTQGLVGALFVLVVGCGGRAADESEGKPTRASANEDSNADTDEGKAETGDAGGASEGDEAKPGAEGDETEGTTSTDPDAPAGSSGTSGGSTGSAGSGASTGSVTPPSTGVSMPAPNPPSVGRPPIVLPPMSPSAPGSDAPAPEGCSDASVTTGTGYCENIQSCSNDSIYSSCKDQGNGTWSCTCSSNYFYGNYELQGVTETTACGPVLELCKGGQATVPEFGELTCDAVTSSADATSCYVNQSCTRSATLSEGITALQYDQKYANCYDNGNGTLTCSCGTNTTSQQYELSSTDLASSCQAILDVCTNPPPEFAEEPACAEYSKTEGVNQCSIEMQCTRSANVAEGIDAVQYEYQYANCSSAAEGDSWTCNCSTTNRYLNFEMSTTEPQCADALALCVSTTPIEPTGEIACETSYQTLNSGSCNAQLTCTQQAEVGGTSVGMYGYLNAYCQDDGDGTFTCSCNSDTESVSFDAEGTDGWDVCADAAKSCPERITPTVGGSSGNVGGGIAPPGRPIPLTIAR
jgi:hypothetical protein